jgi:CDGSH iron-sulfur domain-containing protein 3
MTQNNIQINAPVPVELVEGKRYAWCTCGQSKNQPFCDGAHKGTPETPLLFTAADSKTVYLCGCKRTKSGPYCDGSHSTK